MIRLIFNVFRPFKFTPKIGYFWPLSIKSVIENREHYYKSQQKRSPKLSCFALITSCSVLKQLEYGRLADKSAMSEFFYR